MEGKAEENASVRGSPLREPGLASPSGGGRLVAVRPIFGMRTQATFACTNLSTTADAVDLRGAQGILPRVWCLGMGKMDRGARTSVLVPRGRAEPCSWRWCRRRRWCVATSEAGGMSATALVSTSECPGCRQRCRRRRWYPRRNVWRPPRLSAEVSAMMLGSCRRRCRRRRWCPRWSASVVGDGVGNCVGIHVGVCSGILGCRRRCRQ